MKDQYAANGNPSLESLPESVLCSHCQINNMRTVQNSVFLGYNDAMVDSYRRIFTSECLMDTQKENTLLTAVSRMQCQRFHHTKTAAARNVPQHSQR